MSGSSWIFNIFWCISEKEYIINILHGKFPEYAWDTLYNFWCKISGICIGYLKLHNLGNCPEYAWDTLHNF